MVIYPGNLMVVSAPSGGGKTSLIHRVINQVDGLELSISHTTRPARVNEVDGVDYHFVDRETFEIMVEQDEFIEHAKVFDHHYGTSKQGIIQQLDMGKDVLFDIDWQGAQQLKSLFKGDVRSVFILPPSLEALHHRLKQRNQDTDSVVSSRMKKAQNEMGHFDAFDYLIINDNFEQAALDLTHIILANRLSTAKQRLKSKKLLSLLLTDQ